MSRRIGFVSALQDNQRVRAFADSLEAFVASCTPDTQTWYARVIANGGSVTIAEIDYANTLSTQINAASYASQILYLLPFLGGNIKAAIVPLIDRYSWGIPANGGFVDADVGTASGLTNTTITKFLDIRVNPYTVAFPNTVLGSSAAGPCSPAGIGYWERNWTAGQANVEACGCYNSSSGARFVIDLRGTSISFRWGTAGNGATSAVTAGNNHYYGESASATDRRLFVNGSSVNQNTTNDTNISGVNNISLMAGNETNTLNGNAVYKGRCGVFYLTAGGLGTTNASAFHTLLNTYLITATGR